MARTIFVNVQWVYKGDLEIPAAHAPQEVELECHAPVRGGKIRKQQVRGELFTRLAAIYGERVEYGKIHILGEVQVLGDAALLTLLARLQEPISVRVTLQLALFVRFGRTAFAVIGVTMRCKCGCSARVTHPALCLWQW